jgi:pSer/pThr/pTyr-binding forkhead associated (FHA) protein
VFPLRPATSICGRLEGEIHIAEDVTVSPRHARFTVRARSLAVEDLGTVNGTFVRLQGPRALRAGDEVRVGHQLLRLEPVPPPPEDDGAVRPWGAPDTGARFRLVQLLEGGGVGDAFPLRPGENAIGREAGEVTFPADRYVSARHARIEVKGTELVLTDAGSSNGTYVKLSGAAELSIGDQLLVGAQLLRVE